MKKVSLGIILPGNPDCKQKQTVWLSILTFVCKYGWIICFILSGIKSVGMFVDYSENNFFALLKLLILTAVLGLCALFWNDHYKCPYCGHFFEMKKISDESFIGSTDRTISRTAYDNHSGIIFNMSGDSAFYAGTSARKEYGKQTTEDYTCNKRCGCCGCVSKVKISRTHNQF